MTQETYRVEREGVDKNKKKKSVAFKASSSSKNKGKSKKESSDDEDLSDIDDEAMALFVCKMGKFMKKDYGARKRRDHTKSKEDVRRCYNCKSLDHVVVNYPYNNDNDEAEKKKLKKDKKEKKEKRMTF